MRLYSAKLKTRKQLEALRATNPNASGWWVDVCPGQTLRLRDATPADLERCFIREGCSLDPQDWLCETFERGSLVSRAAVAKLTLLAEAGGHE